MLCQFCTCENHGSSQFIFESTDFCCKALSAKPEGPARVIVVDENRRVVALISRADIIRWVYMNSERPEFRVRQIIFD